MIGSQWVDLHWTVESTTAAASGQDDVDNGDNIAPHQFSLVVTSGDEPKPRRETLSGGRSRHRFDHLLPATWYTFAVSAVSEAGVASDAVTINVMTNPSGKCCAV